MFTAFDHLMMAHALRQAEQSLYITSPNPRVGCVLVHGEQVIGEGATQPAGCDHAEIQALKDCHARELTADGATAYVTLEPCSHFGRTPPCADALLRAGVRRVVVAMIDPNPLVAGKGVALLRQQGVEVATGLLAEQARELNLGFASRMERGRPWVRLKLAASVDGKTALANGVAKWITGVAARTDVHHWRARSCAILTGSGTILADDPELNVRLVDTPRQPLRVVIDSQLRTPAHARIATPGTLFVCAAAAQPRADALQLRGCEVRVLEDQSGRVDLAALMPVLAQYGCNELMVESGAGLAGALLQQGLVDELLLYQATVLLGSGARGLVELPNLTDMTQRIELRLHDLRQVGQDIRTIYRL